MRRIISLSFIALLGFSFTSCYVIFSNDIFSDNECTIDKDIIGGWKNLGRGEFCSSPVITEGKNNTVLIKCGKISEYNEESSFVLLGKTCILNGQHYLYFHDSKSLSKAKISTGDKLIFAYEILGDTLVVRNLNPEFFKKMIESGVLSGEQQKSGSQFVPGILKINSSNNKVKSVLLQNNEQMILKKTDFKYQKSIDQ